MAAAAIERFGWSWAEVRDGVPLAMLRLLLRQPGAGRPRPDIATAELEWMDWMDEMGIEPGEAF